VKRLTSRWSILVLLNVLAWGMLGLYQHSIAQSRTPQLPFANSNEQRSEIVQELREIKSLLKETNALLREQSAPLQPAARPAR
jgi:hypothetical protein